MVHKGLRHLPLGGNPMTLKLLQLKKNEDRRIRAGHPWIFSNEIDTKTSPLKHFSAGEEVLVVAHDQFPLGIAYVNPHSLIAGRLFTQQIDERLNVDLIASRLQTALTLRQQLFASPFYRLIFSEADNLPGLVIDRFGNHFVMQINTAGMENKQAELIGALQRVIPNLQSILLRNDSQIRTQEGLETYVKPLLGETPDNVELEENGIRFIAPLWKGQKTGWFYDHRMNRARLKSYVANKNVLDVFSYLGGWAVQAAAFGAKQVDCVEVSSFAAECIASNAALNQVENKVNVICDDAFDALKALLQQGKTYDVIIVDPPAFVKRFKDKKEGLLAYQRINELAVKLLVPGGFLFSCSCSMHVSRDDLIQLLQRVAYRTKSTLQILEQGHQGPDHPIHLSIPESDYLKAIVVRKI